MIRYKSTYFYKLLASYIHKFSVQKNPEKEMRRTYYKVYHRYPNLDEPKNLIEKIYWMQLHTDTSLWTKCADKYAMREYVKECGYEDYLPKNYGKWECAADIDFNMLPKEFVLKTNNGCGTVLVVRDKSKLNEKKTRKQLQQWLNVPFGWRGAELHYTRIKPCIIAEELLHQDEDQREISPDSMIDYKVWCINGEPESIFVAYNRQNASHINTALFDVHWNSLAKYLQNTHDDVFLEGVEIPKPDCLAEMLAMAKEISRPFPEVRVDFYVVDGRPVIGELTFSTGFGYFTDEYYQILGNKLKVSNLRGGALLG